MQSCTTKRQLLLGDITKSLFKFSGRKAVDVCGSCIKDMGTPDDIIVVTRVINDDTLINRIVYQCIDTIIVACGDISDNTYLVGYKDDGVLIAHLILRGDSTLKQQVVANLITHTLKTTIIPKRVFDENDLPIEYR